MKNTNGQFDTDNFHTAEPVVVNSGTGAGQVIVTTSGCTHRIQQCADDKHSWLVSKISVADRHDGALHIIIDETCMLCFQYRQACFTGHRNTQIDFFLHYR